MVNKGVFMHLHTPSLNAYTLLNLYKSTQDKCDLQVVKRFVVLTKSEGKEFHTLVTCEKKNYTLLTNVLA